MGFEDRHKLSGKARGSVSNFLEVGRSEPWSGSRSSQSPQSRGTLGRASGGPWGWESTAKSPVERCDWSVTQPQAGAPSADALCWGCSAVLGASPWARYNVLGAAWLRLPHPGPQGSVRLSWSHRPRSRIFSQGPRCAGRWLKIKKIRKMDLFHSHSAME